MAIGKQTDVEKLSIEKRADDALRRRYNFDTNEYSENHDDAKHHSDDQHPLGKGSGDSSQGPNYVPLKTDGHIIASKHGTTYGITLNTSSNAVGGSYDVYGRNGIGGRQYMQTINPYNEDNSYGVDSIDTSINVNEHNQIVIKD